MDQGTLANLIKIISTPNDMASGLLDSDEEEDDEDLEDEMEELDGEDDEDSDLMD